MVSVGPDPLDHVGTAVGSMDQHRFRVLAHVSDFMTGVMVPRRMIIRIWIRYRFSELMTGNSGRSIEQAEFSTQFATTVVEEWQNAIRKRTVAGICCSMVPFNTIHAGSDFAVGK